MARVMRLILIILALFLSAASPSPQPSASQRPPVKSDAKQTGYRDCYPDKDNSSGSYGVALAQTTPTPQLQTKPTESGYHPNQQEQSYRVTDVLLTIFTGLLVFVGGLQVWLLIIAFSSDRPVVIVAQLIANDSPLRAFRPTIILRNGGTKPAVSIRAVGRIRPHQALPYKSAEKPQYSELLSCTIDRPALGIGEETSIGCGAFLLQNEAEAIPYVAGEKSFAVYGVVYYQRTSRLRKRTYETYFYWFYSPPGQIVPKGQFYPGPEEYNRQT